MSYLNPPPAPSPVIVVKDYGGLVRDYEAQTEFYRRTDREVRVHECHSACTLALSLPNVCVYPNSIFKFHQAYDLRDHQTDLGVSQQLFDSYPAPVRARLGTLTRQFKILTGTELIALGVRDCNAPRILIARTRTDQSGGTLARAWANVVSAFGSTPGSHTRRPRLTMLASRPRTHSELIAEAGALAEDAPLPPARPSSLSARFTQPMPQSASLTPDMPHSALPKVIEGAQPILPPRFSAYALIARAGQ